MNEAFFVDTYDLSFVERVQIARLKYHARRFVERVSRSGEVGDAQAHMMIGSAADFNEFVNRAIVEQSQVVGGPLLDILQALIQSFIDNPELWIKIIIDIIGIL